MPTMRERFRKGWNAFVNNKDPTNIISEPSYAYRPDRIRFHYGNERSIVTAIYNRIAIDAAAIAIRHVRVDQNERYKEEIDDDINQIFKLSANIDQTGRSFVQDLVMSMFDEGSIAMVPVDTETNPNDTESTAIYTMRVGRVIQWYPSYVQCRVYNDRTGQKQDIIIHKDAIGLIENPLYAIMNEPNSTLKRLVRKLNILDVIDEQSGSGKLDLIIQLPYTVKTETKQKQAEARRKNIEMQLTGSKYGIAYIDSTERVTQLNRSVDNNLMSQIEYLTKMLYGQLGITEEVMNGTANEETMLNYHNRTLEPILSAICDECNRKFLSKTARTQGQRFMFFRDPFKLVPVGKIADIADKFTRNEILSSNELRGIIGYKPVDDVRADELRNKNLNQSNEELSGQIQPVNTNGNEPMDMPVSAIRNSEEAN